MNFRNRILLWTTCLLGLLACSNNKPSSGAPETDGSAGSSGGYELFDAHAHIMPDDDTEQVVALLKQAGFVGAVILGVKNDAAGLSAHSGFAFPFAFTNPDALVANAKVLDTLESAVQGPYFGIGEIGIKHFAAGHITEPTDIDPNDANIKALYQLAADEDVPLNVHVDTAAYMADVLAAAANAKPAIIWSHAGDASASEVGDLIEANDNLYVDISCRNPFFEDRYLSLAEQRLDEEDGTIKQDWKTVLEAHADRFMFGSDIGPADRDEILISDVVPYYQSILAQLEPSAAEAIANGTIKTLLGL